LATDMQASCGLLGGWSLFGHCGAVCKARVILTCVACVLM
jgi:hypothetical protein